MGVVHHEPRKDSCCPHVFAQWRRSDNRKLKRIHSLEAAGDPHRQMNYLVVGTGRCDSRIAAPGRSASDPFPPPPLPGPPFRKRADRFVRHVEGKRGVQLSVRHRCNGYVTMTISFPRFRTVTEGRKKVTMRGKGPFREEKNDR